MNAATDWNCPGAYTSRPQIGGAFRVVELGGPDPGPTAPELARRPQPTHPHIHPSINCSFKQRIAVRRDHANHQKWQGSQKHALGGEMTKHNFATC